MNLWEEDDFSLWDDLLSGQSAKIRSAYAGLEPGEKKAVLAHLKEMVEGEGWQPVQRESARKALITLDQINA